MKFTWDALYSCSVLSLLWNGSCYDGLPDTCNFNGACWIFPSDMGNGCFAEWRLYCGSRVCSMFIVMLEHPTFKNYKFQNFCTGIMAGSFLCPVKVMQQAWTWKWEITIGCRIYWVSPGCTQTTTETCLELRVSTVGRALPFVECKIVNPETAEDCPPNTQGEFCARGHNVMKGYYKMEEARWQAISAMAGYIQATLPCKWREWLLQSNRTH